MSRVMAQRNSCRLLGRFFDAYDSCGLNMTISMEVCVPLSSEYLFYNSLYRLGQP